MSDAPAAVVVASNRGPLAFSLGPDGKLACRRGGGGLIAGLASDAIAAQATWVCAALTAADRAAARNAPDGRLDRAGHPSPGALRMLPLPSAMFHRAYNGVANSVLWFVHHLLFDTPFRPEFDQRFARDWQAYRTYNAAFAAALAEEAGPAGRVLVQDYHLTLTPAMLRARRPDLRIGHFSHTPWAPPDYYRMLPDAVAVEILEGVLGADHAGFLTARWAGAFLDCAEQVLGAKVDRAQSLVHHRGRTTKVGVHPLGTDAESLRARAQQPDVSAHRTALAELVGNRRLIVRVDRTELSKNIIRGLGAYRELLRTRPEWRGKVVHMAFAYPSRHDLPEYREYTAAVQRIAKEIDDEFGTDTWQPLILAVDDDFPRSLAAFRLADVVVVNPIRDGMNLVAKEAPVVSERGCALVLSREAGAFATLGADAVPVNPYDISGTAKALHEALTMDPAERAARAARLAEAATVCPPEQWFAELIAALD